MDALDALSKANREVKSDNPVTIDDARKSGSHAVGGRPKKSAREKRTHKITTYLSTNELDSIVKYCESIGVQPAVFLRTQAMNKIKSENDG
jgi:hypothetical protein